MVVQKYLQWAPTASPSQLAEAAGALARAFLYDDLPEPEREEARLTLTGLLDDSLPLVRLALAESFASAANVPHYMVLTLAIDSSDVAAIVLARSPLLSDAELVERRDRRCLCAIGDCPSAVGVGSGGRGARRSRCPQSLDFPRC